MNRASEVGSVSAAEPQAQHKSSSEVECHSDCDANVSTDVDHQQEALSDVDVEAHAQSVTSSILNDNSERDVFLVDIPTSISLAQGQESVSRDNVILSSLPQEKPFMSHNEPNPSAAKGNAAANTVQSDVHIAFRTAILNALSEIQMKHAGSWCLPRRVRPTLTSTCQKRKADDADATEKAPSGEDLLDNFFKSARNIEATSQFDADIDNSVENAGYMKDHFLAHGSLHNPRNRQITLTITQDRYAPPTDPNSLKFLIPPRSMLLLGDCNRPNDLHNLVRRTLRSKHFSLILLDPPWPNASVKRKHAYSTAPTLADLTTMITEMSLDTLISPGGYIAIWITNKPAIRSAVLSRGGLFDRLNIDLVEEWLWIKTTIHGEPISPLDSSWRKPYESLLIARAPGVGEDISAPQQRREVKRRVIAGVPDLHSRKPCLKELFERLLLRRGKGEYEALEIFARYCVAGWCSWGNEVIKYNWEGYWRDR